MQGEGILLAHERGQAGEGYILGGENLTFVEIWNAIAQVLGKQPPRVRIPTPVILAAIKISKAITGKPFLPSEIVEMISYDRNFSTAKARRELGWQPHSFRDGMAETWAEYQAGGWKADGKRPERRGRWPALK